jgi:two-component system, NtrC family, response regulator AtoC
MLPDLPRNFRIDSSEIPDEAVIFGGSAGMRAIRDKIECVLDNDIPVLIQGESGTGKELVAKFLHTRSNRCHTPFVKLNCAAIPARLLEKELLVLQSGYFAGARKSNLDLAASADEGTLFLDEIGDLDLAFQAKLHRLLHDRCRAQNESPEDWTAGFRFIFATNIDLETGAERRAFHQDLLSRIDVVRLHLLALRERKEDIPQLCEFFMQRLSKKLGKTAQQLAPSTIELLMEWDWPGNLRELENWIARVLILGSAEALCAELSRQVETSKSVRRRGLDPDECGDTSTHPVAVETRSVILKALQANGWSRRKTAQELNISYRSLLHRLGDSGVQHRRRSHRAMPRILPDRGDGD